MNGKFVDLATYKRIRENEINTEKAYEYSCQWYRDKAIECAKVAKLNRAFYRKHGKL